MKCAVVVVLCGLAASVAEPTLRRNGHHHDGGKYFRKEHTSYEKEYDRGYADYQQSGSYDDYSHGSTTRPVTYDNGYQNQVHTYPSQHDTYHTSDHSYNSQHETYHTPDHSYPSEHDPYQIHHAQQHIEQPNIVELNNNLHYSEPQKYHDNNYVQYAPIPQGPVAHYYPEGQKSVGVPFPTHSTPPQYGAPLAPYPPQYNQYQTIAPALPLGGLPQPNYNGYADLFGGVFAPTPSVVAVTQSKPTTTKGTTTAQPSTTQQPNNIFSLLLSLSQGSSGLSLPGTTRRPASTAGTTTIATAQPPPKAQIFSFANFPPPFQSPQVVYPPRRVFPQLIG